MEVQMKRFTTAAVMFGVSALAVWAIFQLFTASQHQSENRIAPIAIQTAQAGNMKAPGSNKILVPASGVESRSVAPVFDSNGALVSDPSGALSDPSGNAGIPVTGKVMNAAPLIDSTGSVISNPSGLPLTGPDVRVAPVIDANGVVVSDPSGILLNAGNP
jgi:hypothetical protein